MKGSDAGKRGGWKNEVLAYDQRYTHYTRDELEIPGLYQITEGLNRRIEQRSPVEQDDSGT